MTSRRSTESDGDGAATLPDAVDEEEEEDNEENDENAGEDDPEVLLQAVPRADAGVLADLQSIGISGTRADINFGLSKPSEASEDSEHSDDSEDSQDSEDSDDQKDWKDSEISFDGSPAVASVRSDGNVRAPWWLCVEAQPSARLLQEAMRRSGSHMEQTREGVLVMAPSESAQTAALELLSGMQRLPEREEAEEEREEGEEQDEDEHIEIRAYTVWTDSLDVHHICCYPACLEDQLSEIYIASFHGSFPYELDAFQRHACSCVLHGESVIVSAYTSAGKTTIAHLAIRESLGRGKRVIYTSPLKALSNQKYVELQNIFPKKVGLMTGDVTLHPDSDVVVMTTEVLSSMLFRQLPSQPDLLDQFEWVIYDEAQYIGDEKRGTSWEECIILLPGHLRSVLLTATIPNSNQLADWIARTRLEPVHVVTSSVRPVPLHHEVFVCGDPRFWRWRSFVSVFSRENHWHPRFRRLVQNEAHMLGAWNWCCPRHLMSRFVGRNGANLRRLETPGASITVERWEPHIIQIWANTTQDWQRCCRNVQSWLGHHGHAVEMHAANLDIQSKDLERLLCVLKKRGRMPLIGFSFEKRQCEQIALTLAAKQRMDFASSENKVAIRAAIDEGLRRLSDDDKGLKQVQVCILLLERGIGVHHSGMLPFVRELTEMLFSRGLLDVVFATDTFAIGINMPAKTVVFCSLTKFDGFTKRALHSGEFRQMAGRAGRRGLDNVGYSVVMARQTHEGSQRTVDLLCELYRDVCPQVTSCFRLRWHSLVHLLRQSPAHVRSLLGQSFRVAFQESENLARDNIESEDTRALLQEPDAMLKILRKRSFLDSTGFLLPKGEMLTHLSVPLDPLFVTEVLVATRGFRDLLPAQIFAVCSAFVGEGPIGKKLPPVSDKIVATVLGESRQIAAKLYEDLAHEKLEKAGSVVSFVNSRVHPQLVNTTLLWASGESFTEAVRRSCIPVGGEGLVVRSLRRVDELMREVAYLCRHALGLPDIASEIQTKREDIRRGVLVIPSLYLGEATDPLADPIPSALECLQCNFTPGSQIHVSPSEIGFSHRSCSERFRDSNVSLLTTAQALHFGWITFAEIPTIRVFWHRNRLYSLANRRLAAARIWQFADSQVERKVSVHVVSEREALRWGWENKFTTGFTQGRSIRIRGTGLWVGSSRDTTTFGTELWNL